MAAPPPPKALCAIGPALVHRATHHQCIAVPVVGVWVRPHGMQPCVADVLRCVPPLHRSHCTQSRPRGGPKSFSPRPLWSSPACVLAVLGLQFADSCGTHAVEMMIPVPLHVCTRGGVGWGSLRARWITAEGPTKRRSSLRKIELEQRPAAPPAPVQRFR